jgi:hypothetical protein
VDLYSLKGSKLKSIKLNEALQNISAYSAKNKGLEAVAYSEKYGIITAPQKPLKTNKNHLIYAENKTWSFEASGNIKALEFMNRDEVLVLLVAKEGLIRMKKSSLVRINLSSCKGKNCRVEPLLKVDGNFEGLTKLYKNLYLMVNDSEGALFQKTQLVLFELKNKD